MAPSTTPWWAVANFFHKHSLPASEIISAQTLSQLNAQLDSISMQYQVFDPSLYHISSATALQKGTSKYFTRKHLPELIDVDGKWKDDFTGFPKPDNEKEENSAAWLKKQASIFRVEADAEAIALQEESETNKDKSLPAAPADITSIRPILPPPPAPRHHVPSSLPEYSDWLQARCGENELNPRARDRPSDSILSVPADDCPAAKSMADMTTTAPDTLQPGRAAGQKFAARNPVVRLELGNERSTKLATAEEESADSQAVLKHANDEHEIAAKEKLEALDSRAESLDAAEAELREKLQLYQGRLDTLTAAETAFEQRNAQFMSAQERFHTVQEHNKQREADQATALHTREMELQQRIELFRQQESTLAAAQKRLVAAQEQNEHLEAARAAKFQSIETDLQQRIELVKQEESAAQEVYTRWTARMEQTDKDLVHQRAQLGKHQSRLIARDDEMEAWFKRVRDSLDAAALRDDENSAASGSRRGKGRKGEEVRIVLKRVMRESGL